MILSSLSANPFTGNGLKETMFYSTAVSDIDLKRVKIEFKESAVVSFKRKRRKNVILSLNKSNLNYYNRLSELDRKIFIKLASFEIFPDGKKLDEPYSHLYKRDGTFHLETVVLIPMKFKDALPIIKNYSSYKDWLIKDINVKREGKKGGYFIDVNSLDYIADKKLFNIKIEFKVIFKGNYKLNLFLFDHLSDKDIPYFNVKLEEPTKLAKEVEGNFRFIMLPNTSYYVIYFLGKARTHWLIYNFLPDALVKSQVLERIYTILENVQYKVEDIVKK